MAKYCANCGRELPDEAMYCPDCGRKFVPRYKADDSDIGDDSSSDYEFNGPFGPSDRKFEGPFGPHSNRGSDYSGISSGDGSNSPSSRFPINLENIGFAKICIILFLALLLLSAIGYFAGNHDSGEYDSSAIADSANGLYNDNHLYGLQDIDGRGGIYSNGTYNLPIDGNAYLSGKGEARLIDSNHSYGIESEEFNITEYETYYVNVDDNDWYVLDIFKCKFDTPSQRQVYSTDMDNGDPIIIYGGKGEYYGYGIIVPNSSDDSTYKDIAFLESIFHYKNE